MLQVRSVLGPTALATASRSRTDQEETYQDRIYRRCDQCTTWTFQQAYRGMEYFQYWIATGFSSGKFGGPSLFPSGAFKRGHGIRLLTPLDRRQPNQGYQMGFKSFPAVFQFIGTMF